MSSMTMKPWQPDLSHAPVKKGAEGLLGRAREYLARELRLYPLNNIADEYGLVGLEYPEFVLVAKAYIYGNIVSSQEKLVVYARNVEKPVVMLIGDSGRFYRFGAWNILFSCQKNTRGRQVMLNWAISLGDPETALGVMKPEGGTGHKGVVRI